MKKIPALCIAAASVLFIAPFLSTAYADNSVAFRTVWEHDSQGYYIMLRPVPPSGGAPYSHAIIDPASPMLTAPECLKLSNKDGGEVKFTIEAKPTQGKKLFVKIRPAKPDTSAALTIAIRNTASGQPALILDDNGTRLVYVDQATVKPLNPSDDTTTVGPTKLDTSKLKLGDGFASLLGGAGGAILSGKADASLGNVFNDLVYLKAKASADVSLEGSDPSKYFNSIVGELNATYVLPNRDYAVIGHGWPEIGFVGRIESDKDFNTVNGTLGLGAWITVDNAVTRAIGKAIYIGRRAEIDPPNHAPAVWLSYDYVGKLNNEGSGSKVETGNNRIKANLFWPLWIAHGWNLTGGIIDSAYSLRAVIDVTPIYDFDKDQSFFEEKLSLEIMPESADGKKPTLVLTYANGKAAPTFTNVNAFLAGVKLPW